VTAIHERVAGNLLVRRAEHRYVILRQQSGVAADVIAVVMSMPVSLILQN
jgi:hypothetical protein